MKVTDKDYYLNEQLVEKLDLCCSRSMAKKKFDNLLIFDGDEGYGKTTISIACAYYAAHKMGRKFDVDNIFFDIDKMIDFAIKTQDQIILWDEAALAGLASDWQRKSQKKLLKLLMVARKKRHFFLFNIPKFFKLNEYIILDRAIGLVHVYAPDELKLGYFVYFKKKDKEKLFYNWKKSKFRNYKKFYNFRGRFTNCLSKIVDEEAYEKKKDAAILSIGREEEAKNPWKEKCIKIQYRLSQIKDITRKSMCEQMKYSHDAINKWGKWPKKYPEMFEDEENQ